MNSHTIATEGYRQSYIRTGYESVIANRTSDLFAYTAKQDGKVISRNNKGIIVEYLDGTQRGVTLGRIYGKSEGSVYPHDVTSTLNVNDTFVKGDVIAFNTGFFEEDILDPKKVVMKSSMTAKTALYESNQTFEDSSAVNSKLGNSLKTKTTKVKSIVVSFSQNLHQIVNVGDEIKVNDLYMLIEDEITSTTSAFDEESLSALKKLSSQSPKSKYEGIVDKIEVLYHGDKVDMSASLKQLADKSDKLLADSNRSSGKPIITGRVNDEYKVNGVPLTLDKAEIKIYITIETSVGVGDKIIFGNQLKSVVGEVMDKSMVSESGIEIDSSFGYRSISARNVLSPIQVGTSITLLKLIGKRAVEIYED